MANESGINEIIFNIPASLLTMAMIDDEMRIKLLSKWWQKLERKQLKNCTTCQHHNVYHNDVDFDGCMCSNSKLDFNQQVEFHPMK